MAQDRTDVEKQIVELLPALQRFARALDRGNGSDDLVQETVVKALGALDSFERDSNLKSWLFTIMKNSFCSRYRRQRRQVVVPNETIELHAVTQPEQEWRAAGHELEIACGAIPEPFRATFKYVFIEGRSYDEAACHFEVQLGTVKSRVNRARQFVMERFRYDGSRMFS